MGFEIVTIEDSYRVKLSDEPSWVKGLQSGDDITIVGDGPCLVVAFSIWSTPDREAAYRAIVIAKKQQITSPVYLLPYDYPEEMEAWLPNVTERPSVVVSESRTEQGAVQVNISQNEQTSPMWFRVRDGEAIEIRQGSLQDDEIAVLLSSVVA